MRGLSGTPRAAAAFLLCGLVAAWGTGCRSIQNPPPLQDGGFVAMPLDDAAVRRAGVGDDSSSGERVNVHLPR